MKLIQEDKGIMIHKFAARLANIFIRNNIAKPEDKDIYTYACEIMLSTFTNVLVCLTISLLMCKIIEGIVFIICFTGLRHYTGGHHTEHHWSCIATFSCILFISLKTVDIGIKLVNGYFAIILAVLACLIIFILAPIESKNKPTSNDKHHVFKRKSRLTAVFMSFIVITGSIFTNLTLFYVISIAMMSVGFSLTCAFILKAFQREPLG